MSTVDIIGYYAQYICMNIGPLLAAAGATAKAAAPAIGKALIPVGAKALSNRLDRRHQRRNEENQFRQKMELGEEYGIHPLQMLGYAGSTMGTGGGNLADIINDEKVSRRLRSQQEEDRQFNADLSRELKMMDIAAEDRRLTRQLEEKKTEPRTLKSDAKHITNYFGFDPRRVGEWFGEEYDEFQDYMQRFQGPGRQAPPIEE